MSGLENLTLWRALDGRFFGLLDVPEMTRGWHTPPSTEKTCPKSWSIAPIFWEMSPEVDPRVTHFQILWLFVSRNIDQATNFRVPGCQILTHWVRSMGHYIGFLSILAVFLSKIDKKSVISDSFVRFQPKTGRFLTGFCQKWQKCQKSRNRHPPGQMFGRQPNEVAESPFFCVIFSKNDKNRVFLASYLAQKRDFGQKSLKKSGFWTIFWPRRVLGTRHGACTVP